MARRYGSARKPSEPSENRRLAKTAKVVRAGVRSSLKRYPRELLESVRTHRQGRRLEPVASKGAASADSGRSRSAFTLAEYSSLAASWLGHATVLLRVNGLTILTDPVLSTRIGPSIGRLTMGLGRMAEPVLRPEDLPPVDVIAISHAHFDHLDRATLRALASERTTVVTARHTRRLIPRGFGGVIELDWGRRLELGTLAFSAIRPAHWGARTAWDRHRGYNSYLIESEGRRVLYAGDTARTHAFNALGTVDLAIFGIGAYDPWEHAHATPEQVWSMFNAAGGRWLLPIHHSTFKLSDEHPDEPMQRLLAVAGEAAKSRIVHCKPGEVWSHEHVPPALPAV